MTANPTPDRDGQGEPVELRSLPREVRHLVHAVDRMRDDWLESGPQRCQELMQGVYDACDAVWNRPAVVSSPPATDRATLLREAAEAVLTAHIPFVSSTGRECVAGWLRSLADVPAVGARQPDTETQDACTCGSAGDAFVPAGHYRDCPAAAPEPHPTEADVAHAMAVLDRFQGRSDAGGVADETADETGEGEATS